MVPVNDDFTVILDTCVLVPPFLRDLLFNLAEAGVFTIRLSEDTLAELGVVLRMPKFKMAPDRVDWLINQIRENFDDCIVTSYQSIQISPSLPDPKDAHVIQAAVKGHAQQIITYNAKHFPAGELERLDLELQHPDILLESVFDLYPGRCSEAVERWLAKNRRPPQTLHEFQTALINHLLKRAAARTSNWRI
jgi:predicted nucleic acid-binding protein